MRGRFAHAIPLIVLSVTSYFTPDASAQFLRLGPFDFTGTLTVKGVYATNVDGVRDPPEGSTAEELERKDYFLVVDLSLASHTQLTPGTKLDIDTGYTVERHANRPDLNDEAPFRVKVMGEKDTGALIFNAYAGISREAEFTRGVSPGRSSKRDPNETIEYGGGAIWRREPHLVELSYGKTRERHLRDEDKLGDKDEEDLSLRAASAITKRLSVTATGTRSETTVIETDATLTEYTYFAGLLYQVMRKPNIGYSFGFEREDTESANPFVGRWDPKHTISIQDEWKLEERLLLQLGASYSIEMNPERDDIEFQYNGRLTHDISHTAVQEFSFRREPAATFGSTTDTDTTTLDYILRKSDLFLFNLDGTAGVTYQIEKPLDGETEKTTTYKVGLQYLRQLSRKLAQIYAYDYNKEHSTLFDDDIVEHVYSIAFEYQL